MKGIIPYLQSIGCLNNCRYATEFSPRLRKCFCSHEDVLERVYTAKECDLYKEKEGMIC